MKASLLDYKRVLVVDDEPDVLDALVDLLPMCDVVRASSFEEAEKLLETQYFDIAVLDIMGVNGYKLLEIAKKRNIVPVMLTAHALSPEDTQKSYKEGAAYYVPKEKINEIATYLNDVLESKEKGKSTWARWLDRFAAYYDSRFGAKWRTKDKDFWENFSHWG